MCILKQNFTLNIIFRKKLEEREKIIVEEFYKSEDESDDEENQGIKDVKDVNVDAKNVENSILNTCNSENNSTETNTTEGSNDTKKNISGNDNSDLNKINGNNNLDKNNMIENNTLRNSNDTDIGGYIDNNTCENTNPNNNKSETNMNTSTSSMEIDINLENLDIDEESQFQTNDNTFLEANGKDTKSPNSKDTKSPNIKDTKSLNTTSIDEISSASTAKNNQKLDDEKRLEMLLNKFNFPSEKDMPMELEYNESNSKNIAEKENENIELQSKQPEVSHKKLDLIKEQLKNSFPRLSGCPEQVIDLEEGVVKPSVVSDLMERFIKHNSLKKTAKSKVELR